mmetsp:Transcript_148897/g.478371  ORF Transcript_148897/g.478371 Transcript_148897/m.478371 type:complete len:239 (-) Transcript_148897:1093-1809(-)
MRSCKCSAWLLKSVHSNSPVGRFLMMVILSRSFNQDSIGAGGTGATPSTSGMFRKWASALSKSTSMESLTPSKRRSGTEQKRKNGAPPARSPGADGLPAPGSPAAKWTPANGSAQMPISRRWAASASTPATTRRSKRNRPVDCIGTSDAITCRAAPMTTASPATFQHRSVSEVLARSAICNPAGSSNTAVAQSARLATRLKELPQMRCVVFSATAASAAGGGAWGSIASSGPAASAAS